RPAGVRYHDRVPLRRAASVAPLQASPESHMYKRYLLRYLLVCCLVITIVSCGSGSTSFTGQAGQEATASQRGAIASSPSIAAAPTPVAGRPPPACINCSAPPPVPTAIVASAKGIVIDADPTTTDIESAPITVTSADGTVSVGLVIASAPQPYEGYEWDLLISGALSFVRSDGAKPAGLTLCTTTTAVGANEYYGGCLSTSKGLTFTGAVGTITLRCAGAGSGQ